jgi:hypothetical protein
LRRRASEPTASGLVDEIGGCRGGKMAAERRVGNDGGPHGGKRCRRQRSLGGEALEGGGERLRRAPVGRHGSKTHGMLQRRPEVAVGHRRIRVTGNARSLHTATLSLHLSNACS